MTPAIALDKISKRFVIEHGRNRSFQEMVVNAFNRNGHREEHWALRDVTLEVPPGQTTGIIGPNGSGKSTILKLISGIIEPTSGKIYTSGKIAPLLELGAGFHPDLSGRENVLLNGILLGMTRREVRRQLDRIVAFAELERFIDTPLRHYSSGMYMRLAFSVAVHADPQILLVDEILAVGDEAFQQKCADKIREFQNAGKTIIIVSHDTTALRRFCDSLILLHGGKVVQSGRPGAVVEAYHDLLQAHDPSFRPNAGAAPTPDFGVHPLLGIASPGEDAARIELNGSALLLRWEDGAKIRLVQLQDGTGRPVSEAGSGDDSVMQITVEFGKRIEQPIFGFRVRRRLDRDTVDVYTTCTAWQGVQTGVFQPGQRASVAFRQRLSLGEGDYLVDVAVVSGDVQAVYDVKEETLEFRIRGKGQMEGIADLRSKITIQEGRTVDRGSAPGVARGR